MFRLRPSVGFFLTAFLPFLPWSSPTQAGCGTSFCNTPSRAYVPTVVPVVPVVLTQIITVPVVVPATTFQFIPSPAAVVSSTVTTTTQTTQVQQVQIAAPITGITSVTNAAVGAVVDQTMVASIASDALVPASDDEEKATLAPQRTAHSDASFGQANGVKSNVTLIAALKKRCASCHTGASSSGDFVIFTSPDVLAPAAKDRYKLSYMAALADMAAMPPKAKGDVKSPSAASNDEVLAMKQEVIRLRKGKQ